MELNDFISRDEIKKEMDRKVTAGAADSRFWRIPDGKSTIRLLPRLEAKVPWKTVYSHRYNNGGEKIFSTCLWTFGRSGCPICKKSWEMHESEEKQVRELGYDVRKTPRYFFNCFIVNDPTKPENNGAVKIISVGKKLYDLILESYNSDDLGDSIFNAVSGFDFEINRKQSGDNPAYPDYSSSRFIFKKYGVVTKWEDIKDALINVDNMVEEETPEQMAAKWKFLGITIPKSHATEVMNMANTPKKATPEKTSKKSGKNEIQDDEEFDLEDLTKDDELTDQAKDTVSDTTGDDDFDELDAELDKELNSLD